MTNRLLANFYAIDKDVPEQIDETLYEHPDDPAGDILPAIWQHRERTIEAVLNRAQKGEIDAIRWLEEKGYFDLDRPQWGLVGISHD